MNRTFDFYEYAGFIIPGTVLALGILIFFPEGHALFTKEGVTFGELGLFLIIAYAAGQLVQGIGNFVEWLWWMPFGGRPSERALSGKFLSAEQYKRLMEELKKDAKINRDLATCGNGEYRAIVSEVYATVAGAGKAARVDIFNGNYGLLRGLAAAFLSLVVVAVVLTKGICFIGGLVILLLLALQRMHRYSGHYAKELFTQYLLVSR